MVLMLWKGCRLGCCIVVVGSAGVDDGVVGGHASKSRRQELV